MTNDVRRFAREFGKVPKEIKREMRPALREAGNLVKDQAARNASWSTRIPRSLKVSISITARASSGVAVKSSRKIAPHGRVYEHGGRPGRFRHPVFARGEDRSRWTWAPGQARPFLVPALSAKGNEAARKITNVVDRALREHTR